MTEVLSRDDQGVMSWSPAPKDGEPGPAGPQGPQGPAGQPNVDPATIDWLSGTAYAHHGAIVDLQQRTATLEARPSVTTSRGTVWLDDLPGSSPADKLRGAWGSNDRRAIVVPHNTTIDAGNDPIPVPAGSCLMGPAGPQTEFSDQGRVNVRGAAVFRSVDSGTNFTGTKGWSFMNLGFEGNGNRLFAPNPMNASGPIMAYAAMEGVSFDGFSTVVESPLLGCVWDIRYFNNISGMYAFKLGGSDNQLWTQGGKGDWGGGNSVPGRTALIVFSSMQKTPVGGVYLTGQGSACIQVEGGSDSGGLDIFGATCEGRNAGQPSAGAVVRVKGAAVSFHGGGFNYASGGNGDRAFVDVTAGRLKMFGAEFRRGNSTAPYVARSGAGKAMLFGCTDITGVDVTVTNL